MKKLLAVIICTILMLATACEQKDNNELPDEMPKNNVVIEQENKTDAETENKTDVETEDTTESKTEDITEEEGPNELPQELIDVYGDCLLNPEEDNYGYIRLSFDDERETNGLYPVRIWVDEEQRDLSGFINSNGKLVVEPKYKHASASSCGYALVCIDNSEHQKEYYDIFGNRIDENQIYTYVNEKGEECIGYFHDATDFSEAGLAVVRDRESSRYIIDTDGNIVAKLDDMSDGFGSCDLVPVFLEGYTNYGYMNKKGEIVIEPVFMAAHEFYDGLAAVSHDNTLKYINYDGEIVIDTGIKEGHRLMDPYYVAEPNCDFSDGIARLTPGKYMDVNGNILPNLENGYGMYKEGLISVFDSEQKMGYADITGEIVIPCEYRLARDFENGLALVFTYDELPYKELPHYDTDVLRDYYEDELNFNYYGYIDKTGEFVIPPEYHIPFYYVEEHPSSMDGAGVIEVYKEGYKYYYNYDGTLIGKNLDVYVEYYYKDQLCYPLNSSEYYEWKKAK